MNFLNMPNKDKLSLFERLKNKALPYIFGATVGLFGSCDSSSNPTSTPIVSGPVVTNEQGEADINDTSENTYHIIVRDEKTLELLDDMEIYTVNHSVEIPIIDKLKEYIAELRILPSEPQTLEVLLSKVSDRVSDGLPENKMWFHPEPINWSEGTTKIGSNIPMTQLADFYETYESDAIINLLEVLPDLWGINTFARSAASFRDKIIENSSKISQILGLNPDEIFYDIYRENTTGMLYHKRVDGVGVSNSRPIVELDYIRGVLSGDITIPYKLMDVEGDLCNILVEFSKDNINFSQATEGLDSDGINNLNSSLDGVNHIFIWDSKTNNVGIPLEERIKIRITPYDIEGEGYKDERGISTNNTKIAFVSNIDGNYEIYIMNTDGSNQINITNNSASDSYPTWSPDGSKIAFSSNRDNLNGEFYIMNKEGSNIQRLTNNTFYEIKPKWSPNGSKIAFQSSRDGNNEIYVMNSDGSNQVNITNNLASDEDSSWSPDGSKIAFSSNRDRGDIDFYDIFIMNTNGTEQINLTDDTHGNKQPTWSPDGSKIAFVNGYLDLGISTMNANGSDRKELIWLYGKSQKYPTWFQ